MEALKESRNFLNKEIDIAARIKCLTHLDRFLQSKAKVK